MRFYLLLPILFMLSVPTVLAFDLFDSHSHHSSRTSTDVNTELEQLKTLSLAELDSYYRQQILAQPNAKEAEIVDFVKTKLIAENLKLNSFDGYVRASEISQNSQYVWEHRDLATTPEQKKILERTLIIYANPNEYFKAQFDLSKQGELTKNHIKHLGVLAEYSDEEIQDMIGTLFVYPTEKASTISFLGSYKITVDITVHLPSHYVRHSKVLGDEDKNTNYTSTQTADIIVTPPTLSAQREINLNAVQINVSNHGSMGGVDERKAIDKPSFTTNILKVEAQ